MFPEREAWAAVPDRASLLTLDEERLERRVESNPWVKGAEVLKNQGSGIVVVEVEERDAVLSGDLGRESGVWAVDGTRLPGSGGAPQAGRARRGAAGGDLGHRRGVGGERGAPRLGRRGGSGGIEATVEGRRVVFGGTSGRTGPRPRGDHEGAPRGPVLRPPLPERVVVGAAEPDVTPDGANG
ncbi:FtsQ-type POTRA domain-containing protein [Rubrobacter marinus]|uniref:FtsQ-type POTRA domain-containing protein n=1 Tax=Rubrobacter marinus TaxID=2653852 RepID=A0A6G8PX85_9ACTN|nr:FtsQ-type POTRA domain-containing protein [Rubrobacter marinus]